MNNKTYDGKTDTTGTIILSGAVEGEHPTANGTFVFMDKSAGDGKAVDVYVALDGDWGNNYKLSTSSLIINANIAKLPAEFDWDYEEPFNFEEGKTHTVSATLTNMVAGDTVTLTYTDNQKSAAGGYTAKITLGGTDGGNYTLNGGTNTELSWEIRRAGQPTPNVGIDYGAESLTNTDTAMQYHTGNGAWQDCADDMTLESIGWDGAAMTVYFHYPENDDYVASATQTLNIPARPAAPTNIEVTKAQTSITLNCTDAEFSKDDDASWRENGTYDSLTAGTEYTIYVRTKATAETFLSYHAVVTVTTVNSDGSTTLKPGETVETGSGGTITNNGDNVTLDDGKGNTTTVTPPEGKDFNGGVEVDGDGNVTVPDGSTITPPNGPDITVGPGNGGTVDKDGNVTLPGGGSAQVGDTTVTVPEDGGTLRPDGKGGVEVPGGSTVTPPGGPDITVGPGNSGTVDKDGNVTLPGGGSAKIGDSTVVVPDEGGTLKPDGKGGVEVPDGSTVTPPGGPDITVGPGNSGVVDKNGNVTLPGGGSAKIKDTTVTVPEAGGTLTPNGDGTVNVPPDSKVRDKDGKERTVPSQGGKINLEGVYEDNPAGTSGGGGIGSGASLSTYPPITPKAEGGKVSVSPSSPRWGNTVTITPTPNEGYEVGDVSVKDSRGNSLKVKDNGNGTFGYTQPIGKVTIEVTFKAVSAPPTDGPNFPAQAFSDLDPNAWYWAAVNYAVGNSLMNGYDNGMFGPNDTLSRAMLAQILYNQAGGIPVNYLMRYDDVPAGTWYVEAVRWAASEGVISGYGNGQFGPDDPITREQLATMLYRYEQFQGGLAGDRIFPLDYADVTEISDYAREAAAWCTEIGVFSGYDDGTLRPKGKATRAEAAVMLMRFFERGKY